jgi:hypothetical protein
MCTRDTARAQSLLPYTVCIHGASLDQVEESSDQERSDLELSEGGIIRMRSPNLAVLSRNDCPPSLHVVVMRGKIQESGDGGLLCVCFVYKVLQFARILALDHYYHHRFSAIFAWQGRRWQAPERGGVRLPRQVEAGGTSHRHPVSGPRGCRALPLHFPRCSLGALRRIGAAMASGEAASA